MKKSMYLVLAWIFTFWILAGYSNLSNQKWPQTFKIGVITPLSGPAANYGEDSINAYKYVVDKFNAENSGKIQIELVIEDGKCDGKTASSATQKLINIDNVQVIVGWLCSVETIPAWKIAQANNVSMIAPVSSAAEISGIWEYVFRDRNDANETKKLSDYLNKSNIESLLILTENTDYWIGYSQWIRDNFKWTIVEEKFQSDEKDLDILAKKAMDPKFTGAILLITNSDSNTINM